MKTILHEHNSIKIMEVLSDSVILNTPHEAVDLMMSFFPMGIRKMILHKENINPDFFLLHSGLAGEILQKFVNYRVQLAIVGDFKNLTSNGLRTLILESNRGNQVFFLEDVEEAKKFLLARPGRDSHQME